MKETNASNEFSYDEFEKYLKQGIINFTYKKVSGEVRHARGTTNPKYIDEHNGTPNGTGKFESNDVLRYWDVNSEGWRSCKKDRIMSFNTPDSLQQELDM